MVFGRVPVEPPVESGWDSTAPPLRRRVEALLAEPVLVGGRTEWPFETFRSDDRQRFLYGFGRDYDDGRGEVTRAPDGRKTWHRYGVAVDIVEKTAEGMSWDAPPAFWSDFGRLAERHGLNWGGRWVRPDLPHVQLVEVPVTPSADDWELLRTGGLEAVWRHYSVQV